MTRSNLTPAATRRHLSRTLFIGVVVVLLGAAALLGYTVFHSSRSQYAPPTNTVDELPDELAEMVDFTDCTRESVAVLNLLQVDNCSACRIGDGPLTNGGITFTTAQEARAVPKEVTSISEMMQSWRSTAVVEPNRQLHILEVLNQEGPTGFFVFTQGGVVYACKEELVITLGPVKSLGQAQLVAEKANLV